MGATLSSLVKRCGVKSSCFNTIVINNAAAEDESDHRLEDIEKKIEEMKLREGAFELELAALELFKSEKIKKSQSI